LRSRHQPADRRNLPGQRHDQDEGRQPVDAGPHGPAAGGRRLSANAWHLRWINSPRRNGRYLPPGSGSAGAGRLEMPDNSRARIVLVDDDAAVRGALKVALELEGFEVRDYDGPVALLA